MKAPKTRSKATSPLKQVALPYARPAKAPKAKAGEAVDVDKEEKDFPLAAAERLAFRRPDGSSCSEMQWRLYDKLLMCPKGKVTTYGELAKMLGTSPRAAGSALRRNPFAPFIPCHRIISSDGFLGGFCGEWQKDGKSAMQQKKRALLASEGVLFDSRGYVLDKDLVVWRA